MAYRRVLLKLSGEALMGRAELRHRPLRDPAHCGGDRRGWWPRARRWPLWWGGGNIFRGLKGAAAGMDRATADYVGMFGHGDERHGPAGCPGAHGGAPVGCKQPLPCRRWQSPTSAGGPSVTWRTGGLVIFGGGCGNPFFTTDTTAALRAAEIGAQVVFKGHQGGWGLQQGPACFSDAVRYETLSFQEVFAGGVGGDGPAPPLPCARTTASPSWSSTCSRRATLPAPLPVNRWAPAVHPELAPPLSGFMVHQCLIPSTSWTWNPTWKSRWRPPSAT